MKDVRATDAAPIETLVAFTRLHDMHPRESRIVSFRIGAAALAVTDGSGAQVLIPGLHTVRIGEDGALVARVQLVGAADVIEVKAASPALLAMAAQSHSS